MSCSLKVALIARSSLFSSKGGDTVQVVETARSLRHSGIDADIRLAHEIIDQEQYDLLHFFNLTRPADILYHVRYAARPAIITPIFIDYSQYDQEQRRGLSGLLFKSLGANSIEYVKTFLRWIRGTEQLVSYSYFFKGHQRSLRQVIQAASLLLPNSQLEKLALEKRFALPAVHVVPNGIDPLLFTAVDRPAKDERLLLCVARIEGLKNQYNLIKAVNGSDYRLLIVGASAPNQQSYYKRCKRIAGENVTFLDHMPQEQLIALYRKAKVHILPSWFETCGLASLEAAAMGCNIVVTAKGYTPEYFEDYAFYCDPASPASIRRAIDLAAQSPYPADLKARIAAGFSWDIAARETILAYKKILGHT